MIFPATTTLRIGVATRYRVGGGTAVGTLHVVVQGVTVTSSDFTPRRFVTAITSGGSYDIHTPGTGESFIVTGISVAHIDGSEPPSTVVNVRIELVASSIVYPLTHATVSPGDEATWTLGGEWQLIRALEQNRLDPFLLGSASFLNIQAFKSVGTYTWMKPTAPDGAVALVWAVGGGGGGGGGSARNVASGYRWGGAGGGGGALAFGVFPLDSLPATAVVIVGAGGAGGAGATTSPGAGANGADGSRSRFGPTTSPYLVAYGGGGGRGGEQGAAVIGRGGGGGGIGSGGVTGNTTLSTRLGGWPGIATQPWGGCGADGNPTTVSVTVPIDSEYGGSGGGGHNDTGTGITTGGATTLGGAGGGQGASTDNAGSLIAASAGGSVNGVAGGAGGGSGATPTNGAAGANNYIGLTANLVYIAGTGGGGGGGTVSSGVAGRAGGAGGTPGGGGGGGGCGWTAGGDGGAGGNGCVIVVVY